MERSHRADHNFAVASIALMIFFLVALITTWMLGSTATVDPAGSVSQLRTPIDDENTRQYFYALYDLEIEMKAALRSQLGDEILDGKRVQHLQIPAPASGRAQLFGAVVQRVSGRLDRGTHS